MVQDWMVQNWMMKIKNLSLNNSKFSINYNRCGKV